MKTKKFYAVKKGRHPGVYDQGLKAEREVRGFHGAIYKSFTNFEAALAFINQDSDVENVNPFSPLVSTSSLQSQNVVLNGFSDEGANNPKFAIAYTDGSYDGVTKSYSYGAVLIGKKQLVKISRRFSNPENLVFRNVAGELEGAKRAIRFALANGIETLILFYDYEGVAAGANRKWNANTFLTQDYQLFIETARKKMKIDFHGVKGHSGNIYNEMVDQLARDATFKEYRDVEKI